MEYFFEIIMGLSISFAFCCLGSLALAFSEEIRQGTKQDKKRFERNTNL